MNYNDKNGKPIKAGMYLRFGSKVEVIYATMDADGNPDLGINASNEAYLARHPEADREFYSLSNFDMSTAEIIDDGQEDGNENK